MRSERMILTVLSILVLAAFPCMGQEVAPAEGAVAEADPVLLRFAYDEGETLTYETSVDGVGSVHVMGQALAIEMIGNMRVTMFVENIDEDGNYEIVTSVDVAELTTRVAGSSAPTPNEEVQMRTTMSPRGELLNIEIMQPVNEANAESPWNAQLAKTLTGGFDLNRMILGQKIAAFPEEPVNPGDGWKGNAQEVELRGQTAPLEIMTKYDGNIELEGRTCARLDSEMCMQAEALGELATTLGMEGATTVNTRSWFDLEAGRMFATMEKTQVSMQVQVPAALTGASEAIGAFLELFVDTESKLLPSAEKE